MAQTDATAPAAKVKSGEMIYFSDGASLGRVDYVQSKDGAPQYVGVIRDMRMVRIPAETLSAGPKGLVTSLTKADLAKQK
jgi:hypothetical protein